MFLGFSPIPRVSHKSSGERGTVHTWWVHQFFYFFVKKGDTWHMIPWDNPAGHCFVLRDLVLIKLFQISHSNWMHAAGKSFVETCLKAIRDTFFSQYVIFLSNNRENFKLLGLQGNLPIFPSSLNSWDILISPWGKFCGGWSAYCNDFLSKQKISSIKGEKGEEIFK